MIYDLKLLNTTFALIASLGILSLWLVFKSYLENRKIEILCTSLLDSITFLKKQVVLENIIGMNKRDLDHEEKEAFERLSKAFKKDIKNFPKYKNRLLEALNNECETEYTPIDVYDCFQNGNLNNFFSDLLTRSGYLFTNLVYVSELKRYGFDDKYKEIAKECGLEKSTLR